MDASKRWDFGLEKNVAEVVRRIIFPTSANAGVAQLVEHFLAKEDVARSNRVTRSTSPIFEQWVTAVGHVSPHPLFE